MLRGGVGALEDQRAGGMALLLRSVRDGRHRRRVERVERRVAAQERRDVVHRGSIYGAAPITGAAAGSSSACEASVPVLWRCTNQ